MKRITPIRDVEHIRQTAARRRNDRARLGRANVTEGQFASAIAFSGQFSLPVFIRNNSFEASSMATRSS